MSRNRVNERDMTLGATGLLFLMALGGIMLLGAIKGCEPRNQPPNLEPYQIDSIQDPANGYGYSKLIP